MFSKFKSKGLAILTAFMIAFSSIILAPLVQPQNVLSADLTAIPLADNFTTSLSQELTTSGTTMNVNSTGDWTIPAGETTYAVIDPGKSRIEVVEITAKDNSAKTFTVTRAQSLGNGVTSTAQRHSPGATVVISDSYVFWLAGQTAINSKMNEDGGTFTGSVDFSGGTTFLTVPKLTTAQRTAGGANGMIVYDTDLGVHYQYIGGSWNTFASGSVSNASETVAGKSEFATLAEQGAHTETGGSGAGLVLQSKNTVKTPGIYTPAFVTCDTGAESTPATWAAVSDGDFSITIDGSVRALASIDFSGDASMADVATTLQVAIRAATSALETVAWSTNHFIISSVDTTSTSAMTVTSTNGGGGGTDISGAGASDWMDCDTGNGTVTAKVLDQTADENKVAILNSSGVFDASLLANAVLKSLFTTKGDIIAATATSTPARLDIGNDGESLIADSSESTGLKYEFPDPTAGWHIYQHDTVNWLESDTGAGTKARIVSGYNMTTAGATSDKESVYFSPVFKTNGTSQTTEWDDLSAGQKVIYEIAVNSIDQTATEARMGLTEDTGAVGGIGTGQRAMFVIDDGQAGIEWNDDGAGAFNEENVTVSNTNYFHTYRIEYTPGTSVVWKVDDVVVATKTTNIPVNTDNTGMYLVHGVMTTTNAPHNAYFQADPIILLQK